jgi:hypothetical protein
MKVPSLPDHPPNFLVASELRAHVTPVAVVPDLVEDSISNSFMITPFHEGAQSAGPSTQFSGGE